MIAGVSSCLVTVLQSVSGIVGRRLGVLDAGPEFGGDKTGGLAVQEALVDHEFEFRRYRLPQVYSHTLEELPIPGWFHVLKVHLGPRWSQVNSEGMRPIFSLR